MTERKSDLSKAKNPFKQEDGKYLVPTQNSNIPFLGLEITFETKRRENESVKLSSGCLQVDTLNQPHSDNIRVPELVPEVFALFKSTQHPKFRGEHKKIVVWKNGIARIILRGEQISSCLSNLRDGDWHR